MSTKSLKSRGRALRCRKCEWVGEKANGPDHYAKNHCSLDDAPFACITCRHMAASQAKLDEHIKKDQHKRKLRKHGKKIQLKTSGTVIDINEHFEQLTKKDSDEIWEARQKGKVTATVTEKGDGPVEETTERGRSPAGSSHSHSHSRSSSSSSSCSSSSGSSGSRSSSSSSRSSNRSRSRSASSSSSSSGPDSPKRVTSPKNLNEDSDEEVIPKKKRCTRGVPKSKELISSDTDETDNEDKTTADQTADKGKTKGPRQEQSDDKVTSNEIIPKEDTCDQAGEKTVKVRENEDNNDVVEIEDIEVDSTIQEITSDKRNEKKDKDSTPDIIQRTAEDLGNRLLQMVTDRPSVVATAVMGVTQQMLVNNTHLTTVCKRLEAVSDQLRTKDNPEIYRRVDSLSAKHVLGDVKAELKVLNGQLQKQNGTVIELSKAVREMTSTMKGTHHKLDGTLEAVTTSLKTFGNIMTKFIQQSEPLRPNISTQHQIQNFNQEWDRAQQDRRDSRYQYSGNYRGLPQRPERDSRDKERDGRDKKENRPR